MSAKIHVKSAAAEDAGSATELLPTDAARSYTHVHASAMLALLWTNFSYIVADPVTWLSYLLVPVCLLQSLYCIVCLSPSATVPPRAASASPSQPISSISTVTATSRGASGSPMTMSKRKGTYGSKPAVLASITSRINSSIIATILSVSIVPPVIFVAVVLHGAPIASHHAHTALLALHMSVLAAPALFYTQGVSAARWSQLISLNTPIDEVLGGALGAFVGAWLGAIPIPLDWDREWQKWPVTIVAGSYIGWAMGRFIGGWLLKGRRIHFEDY